MFFDSSRIAKKLLEAEVITTTPGLVQATANLAAWREISYLALWQLSLLVHLTRYPGARYRVTGYPVFYWFAHPVYETALPDEPSYLYHC